MHRSRVLKVVRQMGHLASPSTNRRASHRAPCANLQCDSRARAEAKHLLHWPHAWERAGACGCVASGLVRSKHESAAKYLLTSVFHCLL